MIEDVAEVPINGQLAGTAWQAPYQVEIGCLMKRAATNRNPRGWLMG
jgi:hypothetical protein